MRRQAIITLERAILQLMVNFVGRPNWFGGGINSYGYALNNPTNNFDPFGLRSYLVSRDIPISGYTASHNFIVIVDDKTDKIEVYSFGKTSKGYLGNVGGSSTHAKDIAAFYAILESNDFDKLTPINASDERVRRVANAFPKDLIQYRFDSTNSNATAQLIANTAQGSHVVTPSSSFGVPGATSLLGGSLFLGCQ